MMSNTYSIKTRTCTAYLAIGNNNKNMYVPKNVQVTMVRKNELTK